MVSDSLKGMLSPCPCRVKWQGLFKGHPPLFCYTTLQLLAPAQLASIVSTCMYGESMWFAPPVTVPRLGSQWLGPEHADMTNRVTSMLPRIADFSVCCREAGSVCKVKISSLQGHSRFTLHIYADSVSLHLYKNYFSKSQNKLWQLIGPDCMKASTGSRTVTVYSISKVQACFIAGVGNFGPLRQNKLLQFAFGVLQCPMEPAVPQQLEVKIWLRGSHNF